MGLSSPPGWPPGSPGTAAGAPRKLRVLIVDGSVVIRQLLSRVLQEDPAIEVVGVAATGNAALLRVPQHRPDVVILDVEMPERDGLLTLGLLRKAHPRLPVIMFSTLTERGTETTLDALALGATDYVTKPAGVGLYATAHVVRTAMLPKLKGLLSSSARVTLAPAAPFSPRPLATPVSRPISVPVPRIIQAAPSRPIRSSEPLGPSPPSRPPLPSRPPERSVGPTWPPSSTTGPAAASTPPAPPPRATRPSQVPTTPLKRSSRAPIGRLTPSPAAFGPPRLTVAPPDPSAPPRRRQRIDIVAIGVSTGGPNALQQLLPDLPGDLPVPIVIVQHMPPMFTGLLASRLCLLSAIHIVEAENGMVLRPGQALIAPGNHHMVLARDDSGQVRVRIHQGPPENSCRPAVDPLLRSVAEIYGPHSLTIVLTGMGQDGLRGCEQIRAAGGEIFVQDEASSVVWGMPGIIANAGLHHKVLPLDQIGMEMLRKLEEGRAWHRSPHAEKADCEIT